MQKTEKNTVEVGKETRWSGGGGGGGEEINTHGQRDGYRETSHESKAANTHCSRAYSIVSSLARFSFLFMALSALSRKV